MIPIPPSMESKNHNIALFGLGRILFSIAENPVNENSNHTNYHNKGQTKKAEIILVNQIHNLIN